MGLLNMTHGKNNNNNHNNKNNNNDNNVLNNQENIYVITDITEYLDEYFLKNRTSDEKSEDNIFFDESELTYEKEKEKFFVSNNSYSTNTLFECDIACLTCDKTKEKNNSNCFECNSKEGYYPIYDSISNCYSNETISRKIITLMWMDPYIHGKNVMKNARHVILEEI